MGILNSQANQINKLKKIKNLITNEENEIYESLRAMIKQKSTFM